MVGKKMIERKYDLIMSSQIEHGVSTFEGSQDVTTSHARLIVVIRNSEHRDCLLLFFTLSVILVIWEMLVYI